MKTIEATQTVETTITRIPVKNLVISPLNVRKKQGTGIEELAALIASQGLIHNLVVTSQLKKGKKTGKYEVVAGGRRLAALNLLIADGRLPKDHEVDCRVVEDKEALEISLSENSGREHMHPADLVMAYRNLTDAGLSPDEIAPRFGVSPLTVKRYLKLANVSPALFQLYAEDSMSFDQISALALTEDHELQERLWHNMPEWQRSGATFRRLITETEVNLRSPLARFVGVEEYEAKGGVIRRDLFGNEDDGFIQDANLLESLALEKLNQAVAPLKEEGYAWVQVRTTFDYSDLAEFGRVRTVKREPTEEEQARMDALTAEMEAIEAEQEAYDEDNDASGEVYAQLEEKVERVQWELDTIAASLEHFSFDDLAVAGAIVTVGYDGQLKIERGLVRKEDMKKLPSGQEGRAGDIAGTGRSSEEKPVHSEKLTRMLTAHRTAAIQAAMTDRPEIALAALVHRMAMQVFGNRYRSSRIVQINVEETHLKIDAENIEQSRAALAIEKKRQYWKDRIEAAEQEGKELFAWLLDQSQQDLLELLAFCMAASINTVSSRENTPSDEIAAFMTALNLDMADWWEATPENYLSHVSKDRILSVVTEAVSPEKADAMRGLKKDQLVLRADEELSGKRWLPDNFKVIELQEKQ
ncbi:chromosome partitioning protein, ParB family [Nitrosospira multiformis]|uniref:Chromosome partitioning protein, ParB family n=1 Tax=Nitrosospira multiformis TaxID=1231 RepID=A0A1H8N9X5_9PROT|nr:ParB/RepB/Spo0J family partition protein [Nitrosospira multiformis]SEO26336.1 chromosome partitioning protein, ParB family [Nitrosospira multiformis]